MAQISIAGISRTASASYSSSGPSPAALQAQLERYQHRLSDCVNCASAKTPQGKADIQAISTRISQIKQSIDQTEKTPASSPIANQPAAVASASSPVGFGGRIDVFA